MAIQNNEIEVIIRPADKAVQIRWREIYGYRHLLWGMVYRNVKIQFSQTYLSFFWAVSRPLAMVTIFALIKRFSSANMHVSVPYSIYVYSGLILWFYFLDATNSASRSIEKDAGLLKKVYFPWLITPIVPVISGLHVFILSSIPLVAMMVWNHVYPGWRLILLPIVLLQCAALSLGVGLIVASLSIKNKDWNRFLGLVLYVGLFVSPVIYSPEMIPKAGRYMPFFNPMVGTLLAFRSCIISDFPFPTLPWMCSILFTAICLFIGLEVFKRKQVELVDKI